MKYSKEEVMQFVQEEDVKFIRLAFCDVFGRQKNIAIMPSELSRAFEYGIAFDASAITGFGDETHSDLLLHPDPETLMFLPWRPEHGKVVRMFTHITYPDGTPLNATQGISSDKRLPMLKKKVTLLLSVRNRNSICSCWMIKVSPPKHPMMKRAIWILLPMTEVRISAVKFV